MPVVIIDVETEYVELLQCITCLGFYKMGSKQIYQIIDVNPFPPERLEGYTIYRHFVKSGNYRLAAYNKEFESQILGMPVDIELMPRPFVAKERFITIESLSIESSGSLPRWRDSWKTICRHNLCCILKNIVLFIGRETYCKFGFLAKYEGGLDGKITSN